MTLAFALMTLGSAVAAIVAPQLLTAALMVLLLVLLVPYIVHYYILENETQKLYAQYDRLLERCNATQSQVVGKLRGDSANSDAQ